MSAAQLNVLRRRAVVTARAVKDLLAAAVGVRCWAYRFLMFAMGGGKLKRSAEIVVLDLREFCFADKPTFHSDALVMARREGRREVWLRLAKFLNLDEQQVQLMMEIDDEL